MYTYNAEILKVVDGDTLDVEIDLGLDIRHRIRLRLLGVNAAERFTDDGRKATQMLIEKIGDRKSAVITTVKDRQEKYGRYLANVALEDGTFINEWLIQQGLATRA